MFQNIGGVALGPVVVGILNDHFLATLGQEGIRYSLSIVAIGLVGVVICGLIGVRTVRADYIRADAERAAG
jgi:succinate dehydrogenase hydrophobic anchor subunit